METADARLVVDRLLRAAGISSPFLVGDFVPAFDFQIAFGPSRRSGRFLYVEPGLGPQRRREAIACHIAAHALELAGRETSDTAVAAVASEILRRCADHEDVSSVRSCRPATAAERHRTAS